MSGDRQVIEFQVEIVVEPDECGYYAYCPALKGLHTCGDTEKEAIGNARDAVIAYLESLLKHGDPIPVGITSEKTSKKASLSTKKASRHTEELRVACTI